ncbi:hypothetical protein [Sinomonas albida]|uniref:hypothetical protein n=1 Tax=Sinomonas albida TaxID=369942 RepID=UPI003017D16B
MVLKRPYRNYREMHLGDVLDELMRRRRLTWSWSYARSDSFPLFIVTLATSGPWPYHLKGAEELAARIAAREQIAWLPVPEPGTEENYHATLAAMAELERQLAIPALRPAYRPEPTPDGHAAPA